MYTSNPALSQSTSYATITCYLNLLISPFFALTACAQQPAEPHWIQASSGAIRGNLNLCVIDLVHSVHTPCSIQLTDADENFRSLGPGLILPDREDRSLLTCQQIVGATRAISSRKNMKNLDPRVRRIVDDQGARVWLKYLNEDNELVNTDYRLFFISKTSFMVLECPESYQVRLQPEETDRLFYDSPNPKLIKTGSRGTGDTSEYFDALRDSLDDAERFFYFMDNAANSSDVEFCENFCPSGFQAVESLGVDGTGNCNRRNNASEPFYNQSNFDYTFACTPCNNTYRYAFPQEKLTGYPGFEFKCQYPCMPFRSCNSPFIPGINGTAIHDTVCDCPSDNLRLVIRPAHRIDDRVATENNTLSLVEAQPAEVRARYYQFEDSAGSLVDYDFLCVTRSRFCEALNESGELQLGFQYSYDNAPSHCFIPVISDTAYSVFEGTLQNNILTLGYRETAPEISTDAPVTEAFASPSVTETPEGKPGSSQPATKPTDTPSSNLPAILAGVAAASAILLSTALIVGVLVVGYFGMKVRQHRVAVTTGTPDAGMVLNPIYEGVIEPYAVVQDIRVPDAVVPGGQGNIYESIGEGSQLTAEFLRLTNQAAEGLVNQPPEAGETILIKSEDAYTLMDPAGAPAAPAAVMSPQNDVIGD